LLNGKIEGGKMKREIEADHLDCNALMFELKIRNLPFRDYLQALGTVEEALKAEVADKSLQPKPELNAEEEIEGIEECFNTIEERSLLKWFIPGDLLHYHTYSQLCHLERRVSYTRWRKARNGETREAYRRYKDLMATFRRQHYPNHEPFINEEESQEDESVYQDESLMSSEDYDREIEEITERLKYLKKMQKAAALKEMVKNEEVEKGNVAQISESRQSFRDPEVKEKQTMIDRRRRQWKKRAKENRRQSSSEFFNNRLPGNKARRKVKPNLKRNVDGRKGENESKIKSVMKRVKTFQASTQPKEKMKGKFKEIWNAEASNLRRRVSMWFRPPPDVGQQ
jgi:hypothetical protein